MAAEDDYGEREISVDLSKSSHAALLLDKHVREIGQGLDMSPEEMACALALGAEALLRGNGAAMPWDALRAVVAVLERAPSSGYAQAPSGEEQPS